VLDLSNLSWGSNSGAKGADGGGVWGGVSPSPLGEASGKIFLVFDLKMVNFGYSDAINLKFFVKKSSKSTYGVGPSVFGALPILDSFGSPWLCLCVTSCRK